MAFPGVGGVCKPRMWSQGNGARLHADWHFVPDEGAFSVALGNSSAQGIRSTRTSCVQVQQSYIIFYRIYYHAMVSTLAFSSHRKSP